MIVRVRNLIKFTITLGICSVIFVLVMDKVVMPYYTKQGETVELIDVRNKLYIEAKEILKRSGFTVEVVDSVKSSELPRNTIMEQQPPPGHKVKTGRVIRLVVSKGEDYFPMSNLIGMAYKAAQIEMDRLHLVVDWISYKYSLDKPEGVIIYQSIDPGKQIVSNTSITLEISKGLPPSDLEIPDLFGLNLDNAKEIIHKKGLSVGEIQYVKNSELTPFTVIGQKPEYGKLVNASTAIDLEVTVAEEE